MKTGWAARFAENVRNYEGYPIGKTIQYLNDPEIISLAGGLPSPDVFQRTELRMATERSFDRDIDRIMQYSPIPGEISLVDAVLRFLERDDIHIGRENIVITTSGQHGLDLTGRLFLEPDDVVLVDGPTFAGAVVAFNLQRPRFVGVNIEDDGSDVAGMRRAMEQLTAAGTPPKFIYVVPDFQNPSGITISLGKREALLDLSYEFERTRGHVHPACQDMHGAVWQDGITRNAFEYASGDAPVLETVRPEVRTNPPSLTIRGPCAA